jgi:hypothetical protein
MGLRFGWTFCSGEDEVATKCVDKREGKRQLEIREHGIEMGLKNLCERLKERRGREDNIKMILKIQRVKNVDWNQSSSKLRAVAGSCEHGNETSGTIKGGNFLTI